MKVSSVDPQTDPVWRSLVWDHPSSLFNSPEWMRVLAKTYGLEPRAYVVLANGQPQAGLSFCQVCDLMGPRVTLRPFSDYCDPIIDDMTAWEALTQPLMDLKQPVSLRCLHNRIPLSDAHFETVNHAKWHRVDLRPHIDQLWDGIHSSARRAIKKAQSQGVVVRFAQDKNDLRRFFELHLNIRKNKYHLVAQPYRFFETIWQQFVEANQGALLLAIYKDAIVGGIFFLEWKDTLYYKFNASDQSQLDCRPNDLLTWTGIAYAQAQALAYLDFGLSDWDQDGLVRYKRKYATEEETIYFLRYLPPITENHQIPQLRALLNQITDLVSRDDVPDQVTERAGEILYPLFV